MCIMISKRSSILMATCIGANNLKFSQKFLTSKVSLFFFNRQEHRSGAHTAQIVMKPEFYDKKLEKMDFIVSLIGEVVSGGSRW